MLIKVTMIKFQYVDTMGYYTIIKMSQQQLPIKTWMEHTHTHNETWNERLSQCDAYNYRHISFKHLCCLGMLRQRRDL